jgi:hypothetical protein
LIITYKSSENINVDDELDDVWKEAMGTIRPFSNGKGEGGQPKLTFQPFKDIY